jgi:2'-5' RNA ligase
VPALLRLQAQTAAICQPFALHSHSQPEQWHPHITLAKRIEAGYEEQARTLAESLWHPRDGLACSVEYVALHEPLRVRGIHSLIVAPEA